MKRSRLCILAWLCLSCVVWQGCSSVKHVPQGMMLLDKLSISVDNDTVKTEELYNFVRQMPNHKVLGFAKLQLATYSLSGRDSTKWYNKWLRSLGQPPVIYNKGQAEISRKQLQQALINRGYMDATVAIDSFPEPDRKRMALNYRITTGTPFRIAKMEYNVPDTALARIIYADTTRFSIEPGALFDRNRLDDFRAGITQRLRNAGYYAFNKDDITFTADTVAGSRDISLTLNVLNPKRRGAAESLAHDKYTIRNVIYVTDFNTSEGVDNFNFADQDTVRYKDITVLYGKDHYIVPSTLWEKNFIQPGRPYSSQSVERTYEWLSQLGILKYINIEMRQLGKIDGQEMLDAYVLLSRNRKQGVTLELEGTNSEGDLGFGVGVQYQHRNLTKRSDLLTVKFRTAYESLSGNVDGFINNRYTEYAGEVGITFPKFEAPFLSSAYKKRRPASTEFAVSFNYQERPEYTRVIAGAAWKYKWTHRSSQYNVRHNVDLIDVNYVRLPKSTLNFLDSVAPTNPLLRYSYEDHFIMRIGYSFYRSNKRAPSANVSAFAIQPSVTTMRGSVETAGNVLYAFSSILGQNRHDGAYKIFGIQYAQYIKGEADYTYTLNLNSRNALAMHVGLGIAVPYLNSSMVPFEKRFYAGGANSVRGWGVRTLGPGAYDSKNSVTDFINQCGDILLNLSMEYRAKLFWVFEGAAFIDAGNIWTIRNYENQPGGLFKVDQFYKQIALAYGLGLRLDFTYFLLRFDLGFKAHNPAQGQEPWPLLHFKWRRDTNFHFAVGYPF